MKNKKSKIKRIILTILGVFLCIVLILVLIIGIISRKNVKAMNSCVDAYLEELQKNFTLKPRDVGEYQGMTVMGIMKFDVEQYEIEGIGNLSIMRMNIGVMQMATLVITPTDKNLPLFSADYMYMLTNRISYLEFYDLVANKDSAYQQIIADLTKVHDNYAYLPDAEVADAWYTPLVTAHAYKNGKVSDDEALKEMIIDSLKVYEQHAKSLPVISEEEKKEKIAITIEYTDGLIEKGGISTDVFKKELGTEKTKHFFDTVFFGTLAETK